mmetsp:Transcript_147841/g.272625  ORF Transcript_147841/g.272625 Transcript_147841/m.272625 type:complete len:86 (-) Transcript_147841:139-396(-)
MPGPAMLSCGCRIGIRCSHQCTKFATAVLASMVHGQTRAYSTPIQASSCLRSVSSPASKSSRLQHMIYWPECMALTGFVATVGYW